MRKKILTVLAAAVMSAATAMASPKDAAGCAEYAPCRDAGYACCGGYYGGRGGRGGYGCGGGYCYGYEGREG